MRVRKNKNIQLFVGEMVMHDDDNNNNNNENSSNNNLNGERTEENFPYFILMNKI